VYSQVFIPGARTRCALGVLPLRFRESEVDVQAKQQLVLAILETHCQLKLPSTRPPPPRQPCCGGNCSPHPNTRILCRAYRVKHEREANSKIKSIKGGAWCNPQEHLPSSGWGRLVTVDPSGRSHLTPPGPASLCPFQANVTSFPPHFTGLASMKDLGVERSVTEVGDSMAKQPLSMARVGCMSRQPSF